MAAQTPVPGCVRHNGIGYEYLCNTCNETLLCKRCVSENHKRHDWELLEDMVSEKKKELQQYIDKVSNTDNRSIKRDLAVMEEKIKENQKTFKNIIADVKAQANKLKRNIDKCTDKLIKLCSELEKSNEDMLKSYKSALGNLRDQNARIVKDCEEVIKSGTDVEVIEKVKETRSMRGMPQEPNIKTVQFCQGPVLTSQLEHLLGFLTVEGQDRRYHPITKPTVMSQFTHKSFITVCRVTQDSAWLSYFGDKDIYRVDQTGSVRETIRCKVKVTSITISPTTGRVWFCCKEDNTVREVMDSNTIVTRFVTDSVPLSLCITDNNTVVVGMYDKIQIYTTDGQEVESAGAGGPYQEAVWPYRMAYSTQTGDVAIADTDGVAYDDYIAGKTPDKHPHIKVMNKHLNVRFRFPHQDTSGVSTSDDRNPGDTGPSLFCPYDVCFDLTGNVLVTEVVTKSIILIDGVRGEYLYTIHTDDIRPLSISLQTDGTLWVGLVNKKVKILKYQP